MQTYLTEELTKTSELLLQFVNTGIKCNTKIIYMLDMDQVNPPTKPVKPIKKKGLASMPFLGKHGKAN